MESQEVKILTMNVENRSIGHQDSILKHILRMPYLQLLKVPGLPHIFIYFFYV